MVDNLKARLAVERAKISLENGCHIAAEDELRAVAASNAESLEVVPAYATAACLLADHLRAQGNIISAANTLSSTMLSCNDPAKTAQLSG
jgi:hypothetical protein